MGVLRLDPTEVINWKLISLYWCCQYYQIAESFISG